MRKILTLLVLLLTVSQAQAQFEKGKRYIGASLSGLDLSYSNKEDFNIGLDFDMGYFLGKGFLLKGNLGYAHTQNTDDVRVGAGLRYLFTRNGLFLGAGAEYNHFTSKVNDVMFPVEIGYCFFITGHLTIEPSLYYKMSTDNFKDNSTVGARVGLGFFF